MSKSTSHTGNADTREKILDAAETLFIEHGFAATSLRAIAAQAEVNLAATNYHFGSKMGLLSAVCHRTIEPINTLRLSKLKVLEESEDSLTIRGILESLFMPLIESGPRQNLTAIMGRIYSEPESITKPIMETEFSEVAMRFQAALAKVLPDIPQDVLRWRFHFMIGSMIHLLQFQSPLIAPSPAQLTLGIHELIEYSIAGLTHHGVTPDA